MNLKERYNVIHGHFYYSEIRRFIGPEDDLITWLRQPVDRVVSNYFFFKAGLDNPFRNPSQYLKNYHRKKETLLEYARKEENQNRMQKFLAGSALEDFAFIGILENLEGSLFELSNLYDKPMSAIPKLNIGRRRGSEIDDSTRRTIEGLNEMDMALYNQVVNGGNEVVE